MAHIVIPRAKESRTECMKIINYRMFDFSSKPRTIAAGNYLYEFKTNIDLNVPSPIITRFEGINMSLMITKKEMHFQNAPSVHISSSALAVSRNRYIILLGAWKRRTTEELRRDYDDNGLEALKYDEIPIMNKFCFLLDTENLECQ